MRKSSLRYLIIAVLIIGVILVIGSTALNYAITPSEAYLIDEMNLIEDGGFEEFNGTAGDCCNGLPGNASLSAQKSEDGFSGEFCLNLTASNHCACVNKKVDDFDNNERYLLSFYYKGTNPRVCNWVAGENKCLPDAKFFQTDNWTEYKSILIFTNNSERSLVHLYAESRDGKTYTNFYDDLEVKWLIGIDAPGDFEYFDEEEYVIRTKADNKVNGEMIGEVEEETGEAYFLVNGRPQVTIKFPLSEVVIILIMLVVIIRLIFKRNYGRVF